MATKKRHKLNEETRSWNEWHAGKSLSPTEVRPEECVHCIWWRWLPTEGGLWSTKSPIGIPVVAHAMQLLYQSSYQKPTTGSNQKGKQASKFISLPIPTYKGSLCVTTLESSFLCAPKYMDASLMLCETYTN